MLQTLKLRVAESRKREDGFTLIELMVVVLIIAVLLAIAIPTFLGSQNKAKDRSAQASVRNTLTSAKTIFTGASDYTQATLGALSAVEPSLTFLTTDSTGPKVVSVSGASASVFYAAAMSDSGTCFYVKDDLTPTAGDGTTYAQSTTAACTADPGSLTYGASW